MGRATQGVRLINISETDAIAAVTKVDHEEETEETTETNTDKPDNGPEETGPMDNNI